MILSVYDKAFDRVIEKALNVLFSKKIDIYTFAFYYDHESFSIEVLVDTKPNSGKEIYKHRKFSNEEFLKAIEAKDLEKAARWNTMRDRNYSLGDFPYKALGWESVKAPNNSASFFLSMISAIRRNSKKIAALSSHGHELVYICSSKDSEVGYVWREFI